MGRHLTLLPEVERPFFVQAWRKESADWTTDSRRATLEQAKLAAEQLHRLFARQVRVVNDDGAILFRLPARKPRGRKP